MNTCVSPAWNCLTSHLSCLIELMESYDLEQADKGDWKPQIWPGEGANGWRKFVFDCRRIGKPHLGYGLAHNQPGHSGPAGTGDREAGKLIAQLTPVLQNTSSRILWYKKTDAGVRSVSSCSCLPRSAEPGNVIPAMIEYHCGNRYSDFGTV